jgi:sigma-B regulation protein RsbU (phosphoserine phosphatase)
VADALRGEREASMVASELATRYEEIDLLYTIADLLGRTLRVEEAAHVIVRELADVVGARRASIMVHDETIDALRVVAGRGLETYHLDTVPVDDPRSIAARVFRDQQMLAHDGSLPLPHPGSGEPRGYKGSSFVSLPITYQPPGGAPRPVGVINLTDRIGGDAFTAGHRKLLAAIATQVGAAIENARLVERERKRVRLDTELVLAQGLQAALMQPPAVLAEVGAIAARTQSAEGVGGDFYKVVPLRQGTLGVMLGDVSSHGLSAAMLMAHATAAAAVLAQTARSAGQALERLLDVIGSELARAEMHVAIFYGIVDRRRGTLRYANAGHPQAFLVPADGGEPQRLAATAPPLGLGLERRVRGARVPMLEGDLLCLFSDGLSESANDAGVPFGEDRLLAIVRRHRGEATEAIVDAAFADIEAWAGAIGRDDRTLLVLRR